MRRRAALMILGLIALAAGGCGVLGLGGNTPNSSEKPAANPNHSQSVFIDDWRLEIATIKKAFPTSEIVPFRISVTNTAGENETLTYPSGQKYDFAVTDASGTEVWRWSSGRSFTQEVITVVVKPAENYNFFGRIDERILKPGEYTATGWITAEELAGEKISLKFKVFSTS